MTRHAFKTEYLASQVAGSCRIEGIHVSASQERTICEVIDGKVDAKALRQKLVAQFQASNKHRVSAG
ncbi:MAG: hypothetical protein KUG72_07800 [Pseudomonadales bacterium]|nr:hypothetical protein [Pseudomonadales bacterium]